MDSITKPKDSGHPNAPYRHESIQSHRPDHLASLRRSSLTTLQDSSLQQSFRNIEGTKQVEVRLKNYSYMVSVRVDAPSIKTVFNTSPCYVGMEFVSNIGEIITGRKKVC